MKQIAEKSCRGAILRGSLLCAAGVLLSVQSARAFDSFAPPSKEELTTTSLPGYPGAKAVVLDFQEDDSDDMHVSKLYERVKVLTEGGKDLANVEIRFVSFSETDWSDYGNDKKVTDLEARTIHADGTVVPFTGKPYLKTIAKANGTKYQAMVFTMPSVEVGSIIEYRYATRISDQWLEPPLWVIQGDLYVKSARYSWKPTHLLMEQEGGSPYGVSITPLLPPGAHVDPAPAPGSVTGYKLTVHDVPPAPEEEYMPPVRSFTYRVMFSITQARTVSDFWRDAGKEWSKKVDNQIDVNGNLRSIAADITKDATTPEDKLHRIYEAVQKLENTDFTREHQAAEDRADGMHKVNNAAQVYLHGRGTPDQLTYLFIGLARAAGFNAYAMAVPNRESNLFIKEWTSTAQLVDTVAIVNMNGKDVYFDPGQRYCPYGHLAWQHTFVGGVRQMSSGTAITNTEGDGYKANRTVRLASLELDEHGEMEGTVELRFSGSPALHWRQVALQGDDESTRTALRKHLESMLPGSVEISVKEIKNLTDYEKDLSVMYTVKGAVASSAGKRLLVPADIFVYNQAATFPHEKRDLAVYFPYPQTVQDVQRFKLPETLTVEAVPDGSKTPYANSGLHNMSVVADKNSVTTRRNFMLGEFAMAPKDYPALRTFYSQFESKDHETIILKATAATTTASTGAAGAGN